MYFAKKKVVKVRAADIREMPLYKRFLELESQENPDVEALKDCARGFAALEMFTDDLKFKEIGTREIVYMKVSVFGTIANALADLINEVRYPLRKHNRRREELLMAQLNAAWEQLAEKKNDP